MRTTRFDTKFDTRTQRTSFLTVIVPPYASLFHPGQNVRKPLLLLVLCLVRQSYLVNK